MIIKPYYFLSGCLIGGLLLGLIIGRVMFGPKYVSAIESPGESVGARRGSPVASPLPNSPKLTTILFTGDVMLGRSVNKSMLENNSSSWPFEFVSDVMSQADITYINLESPFTQDCEITSIGMKFCSDTKNISALVESGVDVASIANNHTFNYGVTGLDITTNLLKNNNIEVTGNGDIAVIASGEAKIAFVSFNDIGVYPGVSQATEYNISTQIFKAKQIADLVFVTFHWGKEYQKDPTSRQVRFAHLAVDAGADLVIGAHPHWVQTNEIYKGVPVYYSLGNFVFDQEWSTETKMGLVVRFTYDGNNLIKTEELPVFIESYGQPHWR